MPNIDNPAKVGLCPTAGTCAQQQVLKYGYGAPNGPVSWPQLVIGAHCLSTIAAPEATEQPLQRRSAPQGIETGFRPPRDFPESLRAY
jgi:hypothetical protein